MWQLNVQGSLEANDGIIDLDDIEGEDTDVERISTGPWDIAFGPGPDRADLKQGWPVGGIVIVGGGPGAGKSTLALQALSAVVEAYDYKENVLYVAKEEGKGNFKARANRLKVPLAVRRSKKFKVYPLEAETDLGLVMQKYRPKAVVIDSIQKVAPSEDDQVAFAATLRPYADELNCCICIISQVNKELEIAGLMAFQHEVDAILTLTIPTLDSEVRELIPLKNRFGGANFVKHLLMTHEGLVDYNIEEEMDDGDEEDEDDE